MAFPPAVSPLNSIKCRFGQTLYLYHRFIFLIKQYVKYVTENPVLLKAVLYVF